MKRLTLFLAVAASAASLMVAACASPAAPAATPTKAAAVAPTKAAEPTKPAATTAAPTAAAAPTKAAAVAAPTTAPAKTTDFPVKGKPATLIVPVSAGGAIDIQARLTAPLLEKELGIPIQVVNKTGGSGQAGLVDLAAAKPDGYTIGYTALPLTIATYLDPDRQANFNRKSFEPVAVVVDDPDLMDVTADSPFKSMKDVIDAAKAKPGTIKAAAAGVMSSIHITALLTEQATGVKFAQVHFEGGRPGITAMMGGHVDIAFNTQGDLTNDVKAGTLRVLALASKKESSLLPGVPTMESLGYKAYMSAVQAVSLPAGTPKEIVDTWAAAYKKVLENAEVRDKMLSMGLAVSYQGPAEFGARWDEMEPAIKPIIDLAKAK